METSRWATSNSNDGFAQTREPDNLFDDDIVPVSQPEAQPLPIAQPPQRQLTPSQRGRGKGRGRGRGNHADRPDRQDSSTPQSNGASETSAPTVQSTTKEASPSPVVATPESAGQEAIEAPAGETTPIKVQAVRGPRHQTGGLQRPKLTEAELSARMKAAALNNAKREQAHREAEDDAANYEQREAEARQRRLQENAARRVMDSERERNRMRKLGAQGGREWDVDKDEKTLTGGREVRRQHSGEMTGGANGRYARQHGGHGRSNGFEFSPDGVQNGDRGGYRGRGRGNGRGRGRGRGGYGDPPSNGATPNVNTNGSNPVELAPELGETQFPGLPEKPNAERNMTGVKHSINPPALPLNKSPFQPAAKTNGSTSATPTTPTAPRSKATSNVAGKKTIGISSASKAAKAPPATQSPKDLIAATTAKPTDSTLDPEISTALPATIAEDEPSTNPSANQTPQAPVTVTATDKVSWAEQVEANQ